MNTIVHARSTATADAAPTGPALVAKAKALKDFFTAQAPLNEAAGKLTDETVKALVDNGFMKMWIPRQYGGLELPPHEYLEVLEAVSHGDGSTGWVLMAAQVAMGTGAAYLPASAADHIFGDGRMPIIAGQGAPNGHGDAEGKGYRLSGHWFYGSGLLHSEWIHTGGIVRENGKPRLVPGTNSPDIRIFVVPVGESKFLGNWDTLGLRATGSIDYSIDKAFVPEEFTHLQATKTPKQGGDLFRLGIQGFGSVCHTGFALGVGRRALDELLALAGGASGKPFVLSSETGTEGFQEQYATAEARYRSVRAFAYEVCNDIAHTLSLGRDPEVRQITLARLALNYVTSEVAEVCTFAYKFGGGHALRDTTLQRCFRDIYSGTQHASTSPLVRREAGRELLGLAKGKVWGFRGMIDPTGIK